MKPALVEFSRRPSALAFMLRALRPSPGLSADGAPPEIVARWRRHRIDRTELADFLALTGLRAEAALPVLYPHVFGFRLLMAVLTHPAFPLPIWGALQVRNRLLQHAPVPLDATLDIETRIAGTRILDKGAEIDLHTTLDIDGRLAWESLNAFYYRGRFGQAEKSAARSPAPPVPTDEVARWRLPDGVGWRFARLTGDYNGIHRWNWYARRLGFRGAFFHSQLIAGQCMARLAGPDEGCPQRLELWLKGPVYFGSEVSLCAGANGPATHFAVTVKGDERPAILGRWGPSESEPR